MGKENKILQFMIYYNAHLKYQIFLSDYWLYK